MEAVVARHIPVAKEIHNRSLKVALAGFKSGISERARRSVGGLILPVAVRARPGPGCRRVSVRSFVVG